MPRKKLTTSMAGSDQPPDAAKSRLMTLGALDGRTLAARSAKALIADLENDMGGADRLSTAQRVLIQRAAIAAAVVEHMETMWLAGHPIDVGALTTLINTLARTLGALGLERRQRDVTPSLTAYVAAKAAEKVKPPAAPKTAPAPANAPATAAPPVSYVLPPLPGSAAK